VSRNLPGRPAPKVRQIESMVPFPHYDAVHGPQDRSSGLRKSDRSFGCGGYRL